MFYLVLFIRSFTFSRAPGKPNIITFISGGIGVLSIGVLSIGVLRIANIA